MCATGSQPWLNLTYLEKLREFVQKTFYSQLSILFQEFFDTHIVFLSNVVEATNSHMSQTGSFQTKIKASCLMCIVGFCCSVKT